MCEFAANTFRKTTLVVAAGGCVVWVIAMGVLLQPGWAPALLVFAAVCLMPLALPIVHHVSPIGGRAAVLLVVIVHIASSGLLVVSFVFPPGMTAALFAAPWVLYCMGIALGGFANCLSQLSESDRRENFHVSPVFFVNMGMMFLGVGGCWLLLSRLGVQPLGFSRIIVLATAVHFHYAGFLLPILIARCIEHRKSLSSIVAAWGVVIGVPGVAVGITLSVWDIYLGEWIASWWLTGACWIFAWNQWRIAEGAPSYRKWLLRVSALSLFIAMALAAGYAFSRYWPVAWLDLPQMIVTHGVLNVFGFALCGVLGWR